MKLQALKSVGNFPPDRMFTHFNHSFFMVAEKMHFTPHSMLVYLPFNKED